jgi:hypothetical protein
LPTRFANCRPPSMKPKEVPHEHLLHHTRSRPRLSGGDDTAAIRSRAKIPQAHDLSNVVETRQCVGPRNSAGLEFRQLERNLLGKIAKFVLCHCISSAIVQRSIVSSIASPRQLRPSDGGPCDGGGRSIARDRNAVEECRGTCIHEPTTGAIRPAKDGVGAGRWRAGAGTEGDCAEIGFPCTNYRFL